MKVVVTGGSGFIGCQIVTQLLKAKHRVLNVDCHTYAAVHGSRQTAIQGRRDYKLCHARVGEAWEEVTSFKPDVIIHAAAETHVDRAIDSAAPFLSNNVSDTLVLLEAARKLPKLKIFCYVSTDEVYGPTPGPDEQKLSHVRHMGFEESDRLNPRNPYAATKAAAEHLCMSFFHTHGLPVVITRGSNTYGPMQLPEKFLPMMIVRASQDLHLPIYGDGKQTREWMHVRDHAAGILAACWSGEPGEVYNLGPGCGHLNIDVAKAVLRELDKSEELLEHVEDRPGHDRNYAICPQKAAVDLGWESRGVFMGSSDGECGLRDTVQWYIGPGHSWTRAAAAQGNLDRRGLRK